MSAAAKPALETAKKVVTNKWFWIILITIIILIVIYRSGRKKGKVSDPYAGTIGTQENQPFDPRASIDILADTLKMKGDIEEGVRIGKAIAGWKPEVIKEAVAYWDYKYAPAMKSLPKALGTFMMGLGNYFEVTIKKLNELGYY